MNHDIRTALGLLLSTTVLAFTPAAAQLQYPAGTQNFEAFDVGTDVGAIPGWFAVNSSDPANQFNVQVDEVLQAPPGLMSARALKIVDVDDGDVQNRFYSGPITAPETLGYRWSFWVRLETTPPGGDAAKPRLTIQHQDGGFSNAWGVEFADSGASLVVTGIGGPAASAPLYLLEAPTGVGDWVLIEMLVDFDAGFVAASANGEPFVSLPIDLGGDPRVFRFCYRGEGAGNIAELLIDDIDVQVGLAMSSDTAVLVPARDTTLYESLTGALANGSGTRLFAGRTLQGSDALRRALLAFDLEGKVPDGASVVGASLTLQMDRTRAPAVPVGLHRVTADWGEGASVAGGQQGRGGTAANGDATWIHNFSPMQFWSNTGGDFVATPGATTTVAGNAGYTWGSTPQMIADVQAWVDDPASNFGWMLFNETNGGVTAKRFYSREIADESLRPTLTIEFESGPAAAGAVPDGVSGGAPLTLDRFGGLVQLNWGASCLAGDTDFAVYAGSIGAFNESAPVACSTAGGTFAAVDAAGDSQFFLVVPQNEMFEGSYGRDSSGVERLQGQVFCKQRLVEQPVCPEAVR